MIIEQIRYFATEEDAPQVGDARRVVDEVRKSLGLPVGLVMMADRPPEDGPAVVWQCAYESEVHLAAAETAIAASSDYASAREELARLVSRIEIEIYTAEAHPEAE